jgi:helicase, putative
VNSIDEHIQNVDMTISQNITKLADNRSLLSKNILPQLRNLVEGIASRIALQNGKITYDYDTIKRGLCHIRSKGQYEFLRRFHKRLQASTSHYTFPDDGSERLMLKYYADLLKLRQLAKNECNLNILINLESFPFNSEPSMLKYHKNIVDHIKKSSNNSSEQLTDRYYIHNVKPFFVNNKTYYEVIFYKAVNKISKFNRNIAFTDINIIDDYAAKLTLHTISIEIFGRMMDITIIDDWQISIRPCEFDNFSSIFGMFNLVGKIKAKSSEYKNLMECLTVNSWNLVNLMETTDDQYYEIKNMLTNQIDKLQIFPVLEKARYIIQNNLPGSNVIRYLMLKMNNRIIKTQLNKKETCDKLSNLNLKFGCIPFDEMPFCTSLCNHNPSILDLIDSIDIAGREHELLARRIKNNTESLGMLYTPCGELIKEFGSLRNLEKYIKVYNNKLYRKHSDRKINFKMDHVFIKEYEDSTLQIIKKLQDYTGGGMSDYDVFVDDWLKHTHLKLDDLSKIEIMKFLFKQSKFAIIYGAAGTGKSTMINYVADLFKGKQILFLANTHAAVDNLKHRVTTSDYSNYTFKTLISYLKSGSNNAYDLLVIDECSTVSNADFLKILNINSFDFILLVGDIYQIESIRFGNWFGTIRSFFSEPLIQELKTPYRTENKELINFWTAVREIKDDITEKVVRSGYSHQIDFSLFDNNYDDEVILCLNYDGFYGINNINRFLQSTNKNKGYYIGVEQYKIGDPILFNDTKRFGQEIYNNLKGRITDLALIDSKIFRFKIHIDNNNIYTREGSSEHKWIDESTIQFDIYPSNDTDEDNDSDRSIVPFQIAYATSIHKAQGLEYDSVKIVITDANEDNISHSIFYTAITRARKNLEIFWSPETEEKIIKKLKHKTNCKDITFLKKIAMLN